MNDELAAVELRAARHAALADSTRLRIVDLLTMGDASPSELQDRFAVPSNLMAHHLSVLHEHGIIERSRSEGDHRRSYVRLIPGSLDILEPVSSAAARRVLFVCTANSARSQLAAALWTRASRIPATSAGTHPAEQIAAGAIAAAQRNELPIRPERPRALDAVMSDDDFIVTVCDSAHEELGDLGAVHWSVPDPVPVGTDAAFDRALRDIERRIRELAPSLAAA